MEEQAANLFMTYLQKSQISDGQNKVTEASQIQEEGNQTTLFDVKSSTHTQGGKD